MAAHNYARMPGPGDLPGNRNHPNSPDYVEPAFGLDDAAGNVARHLWNEDEVGEIVYDLAEADWALQVACQVVTSPTLAEALRTVQKHASRMARLRDDEFEKLNGSAA
jgi:hypothetical protein